MINLCCPNLYHDLSDLEALAYTDVVLWIIIDRIAYLIVSSSHYMSAIHCHTLLWHHPPKLWLVFVLCILSLHDFIIKDS